MPSGGGGGGQTTSTVTNKADPWAGIQPQLTQAASDTQNLYNQGLLQPKTFQGQTYADFAPAQDQAINSTIQRATDGSPVNQANNSMLTSTLNGNYLDPNSNPFLKGTYDQASQAVQGTINGAFGQGGRYGSGLNQDTLEKNLNGLATNIYGGNYANERNNQLKAGLEAPSAANQDYTDLSALQSAGAQQQGMSQNSINDMINKFYSQNAAPGQNIQNYVGLLNGAGGNYGTSSGTTTQPYYQNGASNALGMGLGGLGLLSGIGSLTSGTGLLSASSAPALAAFFSDIRLKENILYSGMENGFPVYSFNYKHDKNSRYRGVMAQDVMNIRPDAIEEIDGYMAVDYNKLGIEFSKIH